MKSPGHVGLLATPWTAAHQAPPSMGCSRQENWSGVPLPSPCSITTVRKQLKIQVLPMRPTCRASHTLVFSRISHSKRQPWRRSPSLQKLLKSLLELPSATKSPTTHSKHSFSSLQFRRQLFLIDSLPTFSLQTPTFCALQRQELSTLTAC